MDNHRSLWRSNCVFLRHNVRNTFPDPKSNYWLGAPVFFFFFFFFWTNGQYKEMDVDAQRQKNTMTLKKKNFPRWPSSLRHPNRFFLSIYVHFDLTDFNPTESVFLNVDDSRRNSDVLWIRLKSTPCTYGDEERARPYRKRRIRNVTHRSHVPRIHDSVAFHLSRIIEQ